MEYRCEGSREGIDAAIKHLAVSASKIDFQLARQGMVIAHAKAEAIAMSRSKGSCFSEACYKRAPLLGLSYFWEAPQHA